MSHITVTSDAKMIKSVIIVGGPQKGTRFRPLSLDIPKPLFPVAGFPIIYHHIEACARVPQLKEILLVGFYQANEDLKKFIINTQAEFKIQIRYLQEYTCLGTAGGIYHFRDQILAGNPDYFFVMNGDVCSDFPLSEMMGFHRAKGNGTHATIMGTEATRHQSLTYGCIVEDKDTHEVLHYVEKPETFVSTTINCGIYLFSPEIFDVLGQAFQKNQEENYSNGNGFGYSLDISVPSREVIHFEKDIFVHMAGTGTLYVFQTQRFWSQIKSAGAAIYANRHYLSIYKRTHPEWLAVKGEGRPEIRENVFVHPTANVHSTAVLGPNVTIGRNATIGAGVRIRESIVLEGATIEDHCCILYSIVGWHSSIGTWTRVEGTPNDPNPNKPFAKLETTELFTDDGKLNPSITVIGSNVQVPAEIIVLNSIVLPDKGLSHSYKNQIIL